MNRAAGQHKPQSVSAPVIWPAQSGDLPIPKSGQWRILGRCGRKSPVKKKDEAKFGRPSRGQTEPSQDAEKRKGLPFSEVCEALGKPYTYVRQVQSRLDLPCLDRDGYSEGYVAFLNSVVALRTFGVSLDDIGEALETEKKILRLLHVDTMSSSPTWYLDFCALPENGDGDRLLLTRYNVRQAVTQDGIQFHLDFGPRDPELFSGPEMGEDVKRLISLYRRQIEKIREKVRAEEPVLKEALEWAARVFEH